MRALLFSIFAFNLSVGFGQFVPDSTKVDSTVQEVFSLSSDDLETEAASQDVSTLLQSSRDVFSSIAGFNFSNARFRMRGYQSDQYTVMMNGIPMDDPEMGWAIWAYWGGLNDITRYPEVANGIDASQYTFSGIGGFSNIDLRASRMRKGSRLSYAITNRTYRNRVMMTHNTGMMKNGWAVSASGSYRWSQEGYVEGTYFNGGSYFLSVDKKINEKHLINLSGFGAPTVQARSGIALQEAYDLTGNNFYNPYWGYQTDGNSGKQVKRNARERNNHRPSMFLTHDWTPDKKQKLSTTIYTTFGRTGNTNLNWYDAKDPRPDYYRYLPSYYSIDDPYRAGTMADAWANDPSVSQINWDALYNANYKNLYTLENVDGIEGNDVTFNRSKYIVEEYRIDPRQIGLNAIYNRKLSDAMILSAGVNVDHYVSHNFKVIEDLLGGDYWVDINRFAEQDFGDLNASQSNVDTPNRLVKVGDKVGYNYDIHVDKQSLFGQLEQKLAKIDWYAALSVSHTSFYRDGLWKNGIFPETSFGKSEVKNYINYGIKAGADYKITGRHYITVNFLNETKAPNSRDAFISPQTRNDMVSNLQSTSILSGDISYQVRYANLKARATAFYTQINNQTWNRRYYHDEFQNFINYIMTGVDNLYSGVEVGVEGTIATTWVATAAFTTGQYLYNSRPTATVTVDNSAEVLAEDRTIYLKNYRIGGMPQTAASIGLKYNAPKFWYVGASFNWFTNIYLDPNPDRRTSEAVAKYVDTDPQWNEILNQHVVHDLQNNNFFENNYTLDAYIGKSFKIKDKFLRLNANVNNILNNKAFQTGGFEQLRYDSNNINKFPPKYGYMYGTTFFVMASFLF